MRRERAVVEQRNHLRRDEAAARIGGVRIDDREEVGEHRDEIEQRHDDEADDGEPVPPEAPPGQLQLGRLRQPVISW